MGDGREIERRKLADRGQRAVRLDRRSGVGRRFARRGLNLGFGISLALAGREDDRQRRPAQPLLHARADRRGRDRRILRQRLLVEVAVVGVGLAFRERHRLAAEAADLLEPADLARHLAHHRALDFVGRRALGDIIGHDLVEPLLDQLGIDARLHRRADREQADPVIGLQPRGHRDGDLLVADHDPVEARAGEPAEHRRADVERFHLPVEQPRHRPIMLDDGGRDIVLHRDPLRPGKRRHRRLRRIVDRPARDVAEIFLDQRPGLGRGHVAGDHQHRIVRAIFVAEPLLDVGQARRVEVVHRSDHRVMIGVAGREQIFQQRILDEAAGPAVALPLLVLHDPALVIEHALGDRAEQMAHAVAFHEQGAVERARRHRLEIIGAVVPGGPVVIGRADILQVGEEVARQILGAVEHQMLEQMREAGLALGLVLGPDIVPGADRDHRRLVVLVDDHRQPVGQAEHGVRDRHLLDQGRDRDRLGANRIGRRRGQRGRSQNRRGGQQGVAAQIAHELEISGLMEGRGARRLAAARRGATPRRPSAGFFDERAEPGLLKPRTTSGSGTAPSTQSRIRPPAAAARRARASIPRSARPAP